MNFECGKCCSNILPLTESNVYTEEMLSSVKKDKY